MIRIFFALLLFSFSSCFLFGDFTRKSIRLTGDGSLPVIIPRHFSKSETMTDSSGNEVHYYYYGNGAVLYFAKLKDTSVSYQYINYDMNLPKTLNNSIYYKGLKGDGSYWRETRFENYKAGYYNVDEDRDGVFDSAIHFFRLRSVGL